jgi:SAM-dependent methyltransferase
MVRIEQSRDILREAQKYNLKDFHKVSDAKESRAFYDTQTRNSGVVGLVEKGYDVCICDVAGGRGEQGDSIREALGSKAHKVRIQQLDIDRKQLGKSRKKDRIRVDTMHLPVADKTYDVVFMNNVMIPLRDVESYVADKKVKDDGDKKMLEMLHLAVSSIFTLNMLEAIRVLKDDGAIVFGVMYDRAGKKSLNRELLEKEIEGLPLKIEKFQIKKYDEGLVPIWRNYGSDLEKPKFVHIVLRKTGSGIDELVALQEQMLDFSLGQLVRVGGRQENKSMIEEVLEEMKKAKKFRPGKAVILDKKFNFDVGGHEPEPPWSPVF